MTLTKWLLAAALTFPHAYGDNTSNKRTTDKLPEIIKFKKAPFSIDSILIKKLQNGSIAIAQKILSIQDYNRSPMQKLIPLHRHNGDDHRYIIASGQVAFFIEQPPEFFAEEVISEGFCQHMAKHLQVESEDFHIRLSRKIPILGNISVEGDYSLYDLDSIKDPDDTDLDLQLIYHLAGQTQSPIKEIERVLHGIFSYGELNLSKNKNGFMFRAITANYGTTDGKTLVVIYGTVARQPPLLLLPINKIANYLSNWTVHHQLPKVVRKFRKYPSLS